MPRPRHLAPLLLLILVLTASATPAAAQGERTGLWPTDYLVAQITVEEGLVDVPRLGQTPVGFTLRDLSGDNRGDQSLQHFYTLNVKVETPGVRGWSAGASPASGIIESGESVQGSIMVRTGAIVEHRTVTINVTATVYGAEGAVDVTHTLLQARVMPFAATSLLLEGAPPELGPDEVQTVDLRVTNLDVYPDTFDLQASFLGSGWSIGAPDQVSLLGGETRVVPISIRAPNDRVYYWGESSAFSVNATSLRDPGGSQLDSVWYSAKVQGLYVPGYMVPVLPLGLLLVGVLLAGSRSRLERRRHEKGKPRKPRPSPREEVLLAELEERNPDAAEEKRRRLDEEYAARKALYPDHRERQLAPLPLPGAGDDGGDAGDDVEEAVEEPKDGGDVEEVPEEPTGGDDVEARRQELLERKRELLQRKIQERRAELEEARGERDGDS